MEGCAYGAMENAMIPDAENLYLSAEAWSPISTNLLCNFPIDIEYKDKRRFQTL